MSIAKYHQISKAAFYSCEGDTLTENFHLLTIEIEVKKIRNNKNSGKFLETLCKTTSYQYNQVQGRVVLAIKVY